MNPQIFYKRQWFQIHLGTAILLSLVAATLLFANFRIREEIFTLGNEKTKWGSLTELLEIYEKYPGAYALNRDRYYGWPFIVFTEWTNIKPIVDSKGWEYLNGSGREFSYLDVGLNLVAGLGLLFFVAFSMEWFMYSNINDKAPSLKGRLAGVAFLLVVWGLVIANLWPVYVFQDGDFFYGWPFVALKPFHWFTSNTYFSGDTWLVRGLEVRPIPFAANCFIFLITFGSAAALYRRYLNKRKTV
jgi:hypothetical protein